ncbi:hypothetical protein [Variovorax sp. JS1663]|uniref:hypothetical protein n=1 Tax=Variovorax sp. JS1663 TaxID=1851577 RepID=UPI000B348B93|nr:hypothetical protein [Variovorax sp. JS1663]OUL98120.1 hypothetical protein A8M77_33230 [Variovorax sp. JS1663]
MSKPNEFRPGPAKRPALRVAALTGLALAAIAGVLVQMPRGAAAGVATGGDDRVAARAPAQKGPGTYQLRCWQYGRLLFDEGPVTLGPETRQGAKLVAFDRNGGTLIVTDTGWTTCLARPSAAPPNLALPR